MRKIKTGLAVFFWAILAVLCLLTPVVLAEEEASAPAQKVRVGYLPGYGIIQNSQSATRMGYGYDFLTELAKYTHWEYEMIPVDWDSGQEMLRNGSLDLMGPLQKTPEREKWFDYPEQEMGFENGVLYASKDSPLYYEDFEAFQGLRVGAIPRLYFNQNFKIYSEANGFSTEQVSINGDDYGSGLWNGMYDAVVMGSLFDLPNSKIIAKFGAEPYYFATTKGNREILDGLNSGMKQILENDVSYFLKLYQTYYADKPISKPAFTKEEKAFVASHPTLTVSFDKNWSMMQYMDNGKPAGICVDLLQEVGAICGLSFRFIPVERTGTQLVPDGIHQADLVIGSGFAGCGDDSVCSAPYLYVPLMLVGTGPTDLNDTLTVAVLRDMTDQIAMLKTQYPHFQYREYGRAEDIFDAILHKKTDMALIFSYSFDDLTRRDTSIDYITIPTSFEYPLSIGVCCEQKDLVAGLLNKSILRVDSEKIQAIAFSNTVKRSYEVPFFTLIKANAIWIISAVIVFLGILMAVLIYSGRNTRERLEQIAYVDQVTGLPTYTKFKQDAAEMVKNAASRAYTLISVDVDKFQYINDIYGYQVGSDTLLALRDFLVTLKAPEDLICRVFADHFLLLTRFGDPEMLETTFSQERFDAGVRVAALEAYRPLFSVGMYEISDPTLDIASMADKANFARSTVKNRPNHIVAFYTEQMDKALRRQQDVQMNMDFGLSRQEFLVYLQPQVILDNERLVGAEALVRWRSEKLGLVAPNDFIPQFEDNGFIVRLDFYMFEQVCRLLRDWRDRGIPMSMERVSVNLSELTVKQPNLVEQLIEIAAAYDVPRQLLEIELTESFRVENVQMVRERILKLKDAGFTVAVDDFGSGYSSLNLLKDLPADILKIDKVFLDETYDTDRGRLIIANVIRMAKELDMEIVVEGVETLEQVNYLRHMGCDIAQGYYYAGPMTVPDFEERYMSGQVNHLDSEALTQCSWI